MNITVHGDYLPSEEASRSIWFNEFSSKLGNYIGTINILIAADVAQAKQDAAYYQYVLGLVKPTKDYAQAVVDFKDILSFAPQGGASSPLPTLNIGVAPAVVPGGVFTRTASLVDRIKGDTNYTTTIGTDLRIIGPQSVVDADTLMPDLEGKIVVGFPLLKAHKHHTDGFNLYCDYSDGKGLIKITNVTTRTGYHDITPLPSGTTVQIRTYIAIYTVSDKEVGQPSNAVKITVTAI